MTFGSCEQKEELHIHEWLAILSFLGVLTLLSFAAFIRSDPMPPTTNVPHHLVNPKIDIYIEGAVKNPGMITVDRGATVGEVLTAVDLLPDADLNKVRQYSKLRQGQVIKIPFQKPLKAKSRKKIKKDKRDE